MDEYVLFLSDPKGAVCCLILYRRIPPPVEMNDVTGLGQIQPGPARFQGKHQERGPPFILKAIDNLFSLFHRCSSVKHKTGFAEHSAQKSAKNISDLPELGKD